MTRHRWCCRFIAGQIPSLRLWCRSHKPARTLISLIPPPYPSPYPFLCAPVVAQGGKFFCGKITNVDFLLVEDDAETRDYLVRGLQEAGHRVTVATSLAEAEVLAPERHWDAMILDRMLAPASGGMEKSKSQTEPSRTPQGYGDGLAFLARLRGRGFFFARFNPFGFGSRRRTGFRAYNAEPMIISPNPSPFQSSWHGWKL